MALSHVTPFRAQPSRPAPLPTAGVLGVPLALSDYERVMTWMDAMVATRTPAYLTAAAVHLVMVAQEDEATRAAVDAATLIVPDGQPLVWALRSLGHEASRIYGPDLMANYCARSAETGVKMYLYGGRNQGALVQLALNLRRRYPGLRIVGGYSPPFRPLTVAEEDEIAGQINAARPDVLWVGIGVPKQEKWMARMREKLDVPVMCGVGAAFDFLGGRVSQAPQWMQQRGLEWTYRIAQEPRRLLPRYVYHNPRFMASFGRQLVTERRRRTGLARG